MTLINQPLWFPFRESAGSLLSKAKPSSLRNPVANDVGRALPNETL